MGAIGRDEFVEQVQAAAIRAHVRNTTGLEYERLRCLYCGRAFDGSSLEAMQADGPVALGERTNRDLDHIAPSPVACKACYARKHTNI